MSRNKQANAGFKALVEYIATFLPKEAAEELRALNFNARLTTPGIALYWSTEDDPRVLAFIMFDWRAAGLTERACLSLARFTTKRLDGYKDMYSAKELMKAGTDLVSAILHRHAGAAK